MSLKAPAGRGTGIPLPPSVISSYFSGSGPGPSTTVRKTVTIQEEEEEENNGNEDGGNIELDEELTLENEELLKFWKTVPQKTRHSLARATEKGDLERIVRAIEHTEN